MSFRGNYIDGAFTPVVTGELFVSRNPACDDAVVLQARADVAAVEPAVSAASAASRAWRRAPLVERVQALRRVQGVLPAHVEGIAQAITMEMGKSIVEARTEARSIATRIEGVIGQLPHELAPAGPGVPPIRIRNVLTTFVHSVPRFRNELNEWRSSISIRSWI